MHLAWVCLLSIASIAAVHLLCHGTVRCEERCGGELWFLAFAAVVTGGTLGWRVVDKIADRWGV